MTKIAAMAICLFLQELPICYGSFEFLLIPFCFFAVLHDYFSPSNAMNSITGVFRCTLNTLLLLLGAAALLRCAGGGPGIFTGAESTALYRWIHNDVSFSGKLFPNEKITLKQSYQFPAIEPFMNCVGFGDSAQECVGVANSLLNKGFGNDVEFKRIIAKTLDSAPRSVRLDAMKHINFGDKNGGIQIDKEFFMHIVEAMNKSFIIGMHYKPDVDIESRWLMEQRADASTWFHSTMAGVKLTAMMTAMQLMPNFIRRQRLYSIQSQPPSV
jgi:hypothetical protein